MTGTSGLDAEGMDKLLSDTRRLIESMRAAPPPEDENPPEGTGTALDGQIRCTVAMPGTVSALELDPRVMRLSSQDLSRHLVEAVNAAFDDLRAKAATTVTPVDPTTLGAEVARLQDESIRQMERFTSAISGAIAQIRRRT